jgi:hypothetical protein
MAESVMASDPNPRLRAIPIKGVLGLVVTLAVVVIFLITVPITRWFFLISIPVGLVAALVLRLWHKCRPVRAEDVDDKHPLKLG